MAIPRVFVSSTWYDLRYIRENIKYFIRTIGYEPVLSEEGSVYYDPRSHVQDACVNEIPNCQMFVLVIGGRYGSRHKESRKSITNSEFEEASRLRIPVFALVETAVYSDFYLFQANRESRTVDAEKIVYPSADSTKIFAFIDQVKASAVNNAIVPFRDFADIEGYLRQQWAGMMFSFLLKENEDKRVADTLGMLTNISNRVEMLSRQILESVGTTAAKLTADLYDILLQSECVRDMAYMGVRPTPEAVLTHSTFESCFTSLGGSLRVDDVDQSSVGPNGYLSKPRLERNLKQYADLRKHLNARLQAAGVSAEDYVKDQRSARSGA